MQNVLRRGFLPVELVRDVRFAVDRAAGGQRHHLPLERAPDGFLQAESHPANLLHEELPAAGGAFVVRQDIGDPSVRQEINQKGLSAQGDHRVKVRWQLSQRSLDGRHLGNVAQMPGHAEVVRVGKLGRREQLLEDLQRTALVGRDPGLPGVATHRNHLHRQGAKIHAQATHCSSPFAWLFLDGGGVLFNDPT